MLGSVTGWPFSRQAQSREDQTLSGRETRFPRQGRSEIQFWNEAEGRWNAISERVDRAAEHSIHLAIVDIERRSARSTLIADIILLFPHQ